MLYRQHTLKNNRRKNMHLGTTGARSGALTVSQPGMAQTAPARASKAPLRGATACVCVRVRETESDHARLCA